MTIVVGVSSTNRKLYSDLQSDIARWLARDDLGTDINTFIQLGESDIRKDLRVTGQEFEVVFTVTSTSEDLPDGYLGARRLFVETDTGSRVIEYYSPEVFWQRCRSTAAGNPSAFTIEGSTIHFAPLPGDDAPVDVKMLYLGAFEGLTNGADSNSLLENHYDVYLYAALAHGFSFLRDDEQAAKYRNEYNNAVVAVNRNANRMRHQNGKLVRHGGFSP